jgi:DNA repair protein RecN (Recombination protein N)
LEKGLPFLLGRPGAGKFILLKAIMLIFGEKEGVNYLSSNAPLVEVEAVIFGGELLKEHLSEIGLKLEEEIHVRRIITPIHTYYKRFCHYRNNGPSPSQHNHPTIPMMTKKI